MIIYNLFSINYNNTVLIISVITVTFDISCSLVLYPDLCDSVLTQRDVFVHTFIPRPVHRSSMQKLCVFVPGFT